MTATVLTNVFAALDAKRPEYGSALETWRDDLEPLLREREIYRKQVINRAVKRTTISAVLIFGALLLLNVIFNWGDAFGFLIFAGIALTMVISAVAWIPVAKLKSDTKTLIVGAACKPFGFTYETLHPDMEGVANFRSLGTWIKTRSNGGGFSALSGNKTSEPPTPAFDRLKSAGLMPGYDTKKFEDLIAGERAGAAFTLVECKLTETRGSGKNRRTVTTFQGLLLNIEYPERFLGRTLLARDGWWKRGKGARGLEKVQLVSKELDDAFTVYSTDQVEARALLTPDRMERLIALERHFKGGKLRGLFEEGHLTLALEAKDQFETGSIFKPLVDPGRFISTLTEIGLVCDLIDGFLTREWVRERMDGVPDYAR